MGAERRVARLDRRHPAPGNSDFGGGPHRSGHPDPWALRYYGASPAAVHRTDLQGRIVIRGARDGTYEVTFPHAS
jgi:hypothetical protein